MSFSGQIFREVGKHIPARLARLAGRPAAVFFHGVEREITDPRIQSNHHDATAFRTIMGSLKAHFDVLPLEALADVLKHPEDHPRALFLMSDDGYANTLTVAAGILEELSLPWTLFISTQHIDTREYNPIFLARLFAFFAPAGGYRISHLKDSVVLADNNGFRDIAAERLVFALKQLEAPQARQAIAAMLKILTAERAARLIARFSSESFLTWDQVRAISRRGVTIGAHAHWHWPMNAAQSEGYIRLQAALPRERIEQEVGPCLAFAYPFGNVGDVSRAAWQAVRDAGYEHAFTTLSGSLGAKMNPYLLPRYGLGLHETHAASLIPLLRTGNARLLNWQKSLAA